MAKPNVWNIRGVNYTIKYVDPKVIDDACGQCNRINKEISIANNLPSEIELITIVHELCHATLGEVSVSDIINSDVEEIIVDNIAKEIVSKMLDVCAFARAKRARSKK